MLRRIPDRANARRGAAMLIAVIVLLTVVTLFSSIATVTLRSTTAAEPELDRARAYYLAQAGVHESAAAIQAGGSGAVASESRPARLGDGVFWVEAADEGSCAKRIRSTGASRSGRVSLEAVIETGRCARQLFSGATCALDSPDASAAPIEPLAVPRLSSGAAFVVHGEANWNCGDRRLASLELESRARLLVQGPANIVIDGALRLGSDSRLDVDTRQGAVTVFCRGAFEHASSARVGGVNDSTPDVLFAFDGSRPIELAPRTHFEGAIFAPRSTVRVGSECAVKGAIVARHLEVDASATLAFDELWTRRTSRTGSTSGPTLEFLGIAAVPSGALREDREAPQKVLGVTLNDLPKPGNSWAGVEHRP